MCVKAYLWNEMCFWKFICDQTVTYSVEFELRVAIFRFKLPKCKCEQDGKMCVSLFRWHWIIRKMD